MGQLRANPKVRMIRMRKKEARQSKLRGVFRKTRLLRSASSGGGGAGAIFTMGNARTKGEKAPMGSLGVEGIYVCIQGCERVFWDNVLISWGYLVWPHGFPRFSPAFLSFVSQMFKSQIFKSPNLHQDDISCSEDVWPSRLVSLPSPSLFLVLSNG